MKETYSSVVGERGDERDKQFAACIEADWIGRMLPESLGTFVQNIDQFEHGTGWMDSMG